MNVVNSRLRMTTKGDRRHIVLNASKNNIRRY